MIRLGWTPDNRPCVHCGHKATRLYIRTNLEHVGICYAAVCLRDEWSLEDEAKEAPWHALTSSPVTTGAPVSPEGP